MFKKKEEVPVNQYPLDDKLYELLKVAMEEPTAWSYDEDRCLRYAKNIIAIRIKFGPDWIHFGDSHKGFTFYEGTEDYKKLNDLVKDLITRRMLYALT